MAGIRLGKVRNPAAVIVLSIVTIGVYSVFWQCVTLRDIKRYAGRGIGAGFGLLFAILLGVVNAFVIPKEVGELFVASGHEKPVGALTGFWIFLPLVGWVIWVVKIQRHLNLYWDHLSPIPSW